MPFRDVYHRLCDHFHWRKHQIVATPKTNTIKSLSSSSSSLMTTNLIDNNNNINNNHLTTTTAATATNHDNIKDSAKIGANIAPVVDINREQQQRQQRRRRQQPSQTIEYSVQFIKQTNQIIVIPQIYKTTTTTSTTTSTTAATTASQPPAIPTQTGQLHMCCSHCTYEN